jgi:hypothetical protein
VFHNTRLERLVKYKDSSLLASLVNYKENVML